jgi:hypothetical protein
MTNLERRGIAKRVMGRDQVSSITCRPYRVATCHVFWGRRVDGTADEQVGRDHWNHCTIFVQAQCSKFEGKLVERTPVGRLMIRETLYVCNDPCDDLVR